MNQHESLERQKQGSRLRLTDAGRIAGESFDGIKVFGFWGYATEGRFWSSQSGPTVERGWNDVREGCVWVRAAAWTRRGHRRKTFLDDSCIRSKDLAICDIESAARKAFPPPEDQIAGYILGVPYTHAENYEFDLYDYGR